MIKLINSIIAIFLGISMVNAQHLIITNINDTIEAKIISKDDSIYTYKRLQKPKIEKQIATKNVVRLIPIGDDTLFNTFITVRRLAMFLLADY